MRTNVPRGVSAIELAVLTVFDRIIEENVIHDCGKLQREHFTNIYLALFYFQRYCLISKIEVLLF